MLSLCVSRKADPVPAASLVGRKFIRCVCRHPFFHFPPRPCPFVWEQWINQPGYPPTELSQLLPEKLALVKLTPALFLLCPLFVWCRYIKEREVFMTATVGSATHRSSFHVKYATLPDQVSCHLTQASFPYLADPSFDIM
jgi:hypothetical protein